MRYLGGKHSLSKDLVAAMLPHIYAGGIWIEPFVGMCNMLKSLNAANICAFSRYIFNDANPKIKILFNAYLENWYPIQENITKEEYAQLKKEDLLTPLHCFTSYVSFGGKEWGGFCQDKQNYNYWKACKNAMEKKLTELEKLFSDSFEFTNKDYKDICSSVVNEKTTIYCDPPYEGTTQYSAEKATNFNHEEKHKVFKKWADLGAKVFVSGFDYEFADKPQYEIIFKKERKSCVTGINEGRDKSKIEVLAMVKN